MAGFIKTVNLWDTNITDAIESGKLTLNAGQWVTCGTGGVKSRFVAFDPASKTYDVVHGATVEEVNARFAARMEARKLAEARRASKLAA